MSSEHGALCLVLHSHMPYVEGFGTWPFGEEWLWEAIATVYLPLAALLERTGAPLTLGLTPVLCDQLEALDGEPLGRLRHFLAEVRAGVHAEDAHGLDTGGYAELADEVRRGAGDYAAALAAVDREPGLLSRFAALGRGSVELMASAATHAVLPLLATDAGLDLQLATGCAAHARRFGPATGAFWTPECAWAPGLDEGLARHGASHTCVDQTAAHGLGAPEALEPVLTPAGVACVPLDWATIGLVWSDRGYPAHPEYRDSHRRTIHDVRAWANSGGPYDAGAGAARARLDARHFVEHCARRLEAHAGAGRGPGLLCAALDTELLGHWWYEGPVWLEAVIEEAPRAGVELATLQDGLARCEPAEGSPVASTWGRGRDLSTWDSPPVAGVAFAQRRAELAVVAAGARSEPPALARAARELLALQSSDWAFQLHRDLAGDYPARRVEGHLGAIDAALGALVDSAPAPEPSLRRLAPDLDVASLLAP